MPKESKALKGRDKILDRDVSLIVLPCHALSGLSDTYAFAIPRALPWAFMLLPLRGERRRGTTSKPRAQGILIPTGGKQKMEIRPIDRTLPKMLL
jgi:hypothetical protein